MRPEERAALEAGGWRIGNAADFLELTDEEQQFVSLRIQLARRIRQLRETNRLTQKEVAARLRFTRPRVAEIEAASPDVTLDQMFRGLFALGGRLSDLKDAPGPTEPTRNRARAKR